LPKETLGLAVVQPLSTALGFLGAVAFFAGLVAIIWASESALVVENSRDRVPVGCDSHRVDRRRHPEITSAAGRRG